MPRAQVPKEIVAAREAKAVLLRQQGYTQAQIAEAIGVDQGTVSRILSRVTARVLKQMADYVADVKIGQVETLAWIESEALRSWEKSKTRRVRSIRKTTTKAGKTADDDDGPTGDRPDGGMVEVVERDGDSRHLHTAMSAMAEIRKLLGLDVAPADNESVGTIAKLTGDLFQRGADYERRQAAESVPGHPVGAGGPAGGGADEVPDGPQPV